MPISHDLLLGALETLRFRIEEFQEIPDSENLRVALNGALRAAKSKLSVPMKPDTEVDQWRCILRRQVKETRLALESRDKHLGLTAVRDASGIVIRLIKASPHVPSEAVSN